MGRRTFLPKAAAAPTYLATAATVALASSFDKPAFAAAAKQFNAAQGATTLLRRASFGARPFTRKNWGSAVNKGLRMPNSSWTFEALR